jgi:hypothetical protein
VIPYAKIHGTKHRSWLTALPAPRPTKVAAIALANKIARMAWATQTQGDLISNGAPLHWLGRGPPDQTVSAANPCAGSASVGVCADIGSCSTVAR